MTKEILLAGFGGQGILFAGKQIAHAAMHKGMRVSWMPSYGPEMRGGVANCSVIISKNEISSPLINRSDILIALNLPSYEKYEPKIKPGGILIADSSLIPKKSTRSDISAHYIPATKLASENRLEGGANVIMLGCLLQHTTLFDIDEFILLMIKSIPPSRANLIESNVEALEIGYYYNC